jgi:hypothetical protein
MVCRALEQRSEPIMIVGAIDPAVAARRRLECGLNDLDRLRYHGDQRVAIYRETGVLTPTGAMSFQRSISQPRRGARRSSGRSSPGFGSADARGAAFLAYGKIWYNC